MKKNKIIVIAILAIIVIAISSIFIYNMIIKNGREYGIEKVNNYNYFVLKHEEKYGVIDRNGNVIIQAKYEDVKIPNPEKAIFQCIENENSKILNEKGQEIFTQYDLVEPIRLKNLQSDLMYEKSVLRYKKDNKYGLMNFEEKEITKPIYDEIDNLAYKEGELLVKQNEKYGIINIKGNNLVPIEYDEINIDKYYSDNNSYKDAGYIVSVKTEEGYRYGYIDTKGKLLLKTEYNEISRINEIEDIENIYLLAAKNGQYGISKNGEQIISNEYQSIVYDKVNKVFIVEKSKKYGVKDINGKEIVPIEYSQIDITGMYIYAVNGQGTTIYTPTGSQANINENIAIVNTENENYKIRINTENGTKYGIIDKEGRQIVEEKYNYIEYLFDNYFIVSIDNGKLGIIDNKGNPKLEAKYDSIQKIYNKNMIQATITQNKVTEIYSKDIEKICEMQNAIIENKSDYIKVYNDAEEKYFDNNGKELTNVEVYKNNQLFAKSQDGKGGYVDKNGNIKVNYESDKVTEFNEYGFAGVQKDGKWGVINREGKLILEPTYEFNNSEIPSFIGKYYKVIYGFGEIYYTDNLK